MYGVYIHLKSVNQSFGGQGYQKLMQLRARWGANPGACWLHPRLHNPCSGDMWAARRTGTVWHVGRTTDLETHDVGGVFKLHTDRALIFS